MFVHSVAVVVALDVVVGVVDGMGRGHRIASSHRVLPGPLAGQLGVLVLQDEEQVINKRSASKIDMTQFKIVESLKVCTVLSRKRLSDAQATICHSLLHYRQK